MWRSKTCFAHCWRFVAGESETWFWMLVLQAHCVLSSSMNIKINKLKDMIQYQFSKCCDPFISSLYYNYPNKMHNVSSIIPSGCSLVWITCDLDGLYVMLFVWSLRTFISINFLFSNKIGKWNSFFLISNIVSIIILYMEIEQFSS